MNKSFLLLTLLLCCSRVFAQAPDKNWQGIATDGNNNHSATSSVCDEAGNLYVGGYFYGTVDFNFGTGVHNLTSVNSRDGFIAKYNRFGAFLWAYAFSGTGDQQVNALSVSPNGQLHIAGKFVNTMTVNASGGATSLIASGAQSDAFMITFNSVTAAHIQSYRVGGGSTESGTAIKSDLSGNIYVAGIFTGAGVNFNVKGGTNTLSAVGATDVFVAKYDNSYNLQWIYKIGGSSDDGITAIDADAAGNVYAAGSFNGSNVSFGGSVTLSANGGTSIDGFIAKISPSGNTIWAKQVGGPSQDEISALKLNGKGQLYIGGSFVNTANLNPNGTAQNFTAIGGLDVFVARLDTNNATASWIKHFASTGASQSDILYSLDVDTMDNVYSAGIYAGTGYFPVGVTQSALTSVSGGLDAFVSKLNASGNFVWSKNFDYSGNSDQVYSINVSRDGKIVYLAGATGGSIFAARYSNCPLPAGAITGPSRYCISPTTLSYSVDSVPGALAYIWKLPATWTGTSGNRSINVTTSNPAVSGLVSVDVVTACGDTFSRNIAVNFSVVNIDDNLVRLWLANGNDTNDIKNNFSLSRVNAGNDTGRAGVANTAYRIAGTNGYLKLQPNASLPGGATTIAFWYYYQKNGVANNVLIGSNTSTIPAGHPLMLISNSTSTLYTWSNTGAPIGSGYPITENAWTHITLSRNGSDFSLYLNGELVQTGTNLSASQFDRIGNNRPGFETQGATGKFDDIRVYNNILQATQVKGIYEYGTVTRLDIPGSLCAGGSSNVQVDFSPASTNTIYTWSLNGVISGFNSPVFSFTPVATDSLIAVKSSFSCLNETYPKKIIVTAKDSISIRDTFCGSYAVGGKVYYNSGFYIDTLVNKRGCDSIVYSNVIINNANAFNLGSKLVYYWTMNAADSLKDIVTNTALASTNTSAASDRWGNTGSARSIDNQNGLFSPAAPLAVAGQHVTVSFWYRYSSSAYTGIRGLLGTAETNAMANLLYVDSDGKLKARYYINLINIGTVAMNTALVPDNWYHIVLTRFGINSDQAKVYVNGKLEITASNISASAITRLGSAMASGNGGVGTFDELKVYSGTFPEDQLTVMHQRPALLGLSKQTVCEGSNASVWGYTTSDPASKFAILLNGAEAANDTSYTRNNIMLSDTLSFRVYNNCIFEEYKIRLNIIPAAKTIADTFSSCAAYTYNGKSYTLPGTYYDTVQNVSGCSQAVTLNLAMIAPTNLNNGLIRYWTLNSADNRTDVVSGETYHVTTATAASGRSGKSGTGLNIGATGQVIRPTTLLPQSNISISFWYQWNTSAYTGARSLISNGQANGNMAKYLYVNSNRQLFCGINTLNAGQSTGFTLTTGTWYHFTYQISSTGTVKVYVNGQLQTTINAVPVYTIEYIGNRPDGNEPGVGNFDDIRVYNRLITDQEAEKLYAMPTLISKPTTAQTLCSGSSVRLGFDFDLDSTTSYSYIKNQVKLNSDSVLLVNNIGVNDTLYVLSVKSAGCGELNFPVKLNVIQGGAVGPALSYNTSTSRIIATSAYASYKLYRNGQLIDSSNTSGNINFATTLCGNYYATYANAGGGACPATSPLLSRPIDTVNIARSICTGKSFLFGNTTLTTAGVYVRTTTSVHGCDSTIRLTLSLAGSSSYAFSRSGCGSIVVNGKTYTQGGVYTDTLVNIAGCDSIITLNLTINQGGPSINTITVTACNSYILNGKTYTLTGLHRDTLYGASASGCDSILVLNLTLTANGSEQEVQACKSYLFNGLTLTQSGVYYDTLTNAANCDSVVVLDLVINNVNTTVTRSGNTLSAIETGAVYRWIDCSTDMPVTGADARVFTPVITGSYKVVVIKNGCTDTSACNNVVVAPCNTSMITTTGGADSVRCKTLSVTGVNVLLPATLNISWEANPVGNTVTMQSTIHVYENVCPGTYKIKLTGADGCSDSTVVKINEPVGLNDLLQIEQLKIYPNPVNDLLYVEQPGIHSAPFAITVADVQGRIFYSKVSTGEKTGIHLQELAPGIYLLMIKQGEATLVRRFVKQ